MFSPFSVGIILFIQNIREKEDFKYYEHNKQLDKNDYPELLSPGRKIPESIYV